MKTSYSPVQNTKTLYFSQTIKVRLFYSIITKPLHKVEQGAQNIKSSGF